VTAAAGDPDGPDQPGHTLALYDSDESLRVRALPYLRAGLDRGESVVVVVSEEVAQVLRAALGSDADRVEWRAAGAMYLRLGSMFEGFRRFLAERRAAGARMRLLTQGEVGPEAGRMAAYLRFEAMSNEVLSPYGYAIACLYDRRSRSEELVHHIREVHPRTLEPGGRTVPTGEYAEPTEYVTRATALAPVPDSVDVESELTDLDELAGLRRHLAAWAAAVGMNRDDVSELLHAVGEVATNALQHGRPPARVRTWVAARVAWVRVDDRGTGLVHPTAGYLRPSTTVDRGVGLWLARQLADVVNVRSDRTGTTVELHFPLSPAS
jgi:anti-sigma regulatory factor (Ser/Thr protein kinase)